jgi:hypothetical protein
MDPSSNPTGASNHDVAQLGTGTKDGNGAGDHDEPYRFRRRLTSRAPYPFTEQQFARLLMLRGRVRDSNSAADRAVDGSPFDGVTNVTRHSDSPHSPPGTECI